MLSILLFYVFLSEKDIISLNFLSVLSFLGVFIFALIGTLSWNVHKELSMQLILII